MVNKKNIGLDIKGALSSLEDTTKETTNTNTNINTGKNTNDDTINNIDTKVNTTADTNTKFILKKKVDDKKDKKAFNVYMVDSLVKEMDKLSKKSGYSRNELINIACNNLVNNVELVEE